MRINKRAERAYSSGRSVYARSIIFRVMMVLMCLLVLAAGILLAPKRQAEASSAPQEEQRAGKKSSSGDFASLPLQVEKSSDGIWTRIEESVIERRGERQIVPEAYLTLRLNKAALVQLLNQAPKEFSADARERPVVLELPMPDGAFQRFRIEESPIMEPELAAKFPEIKTYKGQSLDDPTATTRFDLTPQGFHAIILSTQNTVYIDPYAKGDTDNYITYDKRDVRRTGEPFRCFVNSEKSVERLGLSPLASDVSNGVTLRTYRLAVAATGEYTAFHGGTVALGQAAIVTAMNRVNGIYEREVSLRMVLVANNSSVVYTNAVTDPYTNDDGFAMLTQNQANLTVAIGTANYDIGHVFSTGGGGVAALGSPCNASAKAQGVTGSPSPTGDAFWVDYVAHEMGHQWGGNHTFNGTTLNCGGGNREPTAAYEPGSGSTIQGYAGICAAENLQSNSNDYFHVKSLEEIVAFITSGNGSTCDATSATGNTIPTVNGGTDFNIPANTPFTLTATGSDGDGDALTYCWEQYDLGAQGPPNTDDGSRPIFRSYSPTTSPARTFPSLQYILNNANVPPATYACPTGTCLTGESLPATTRNLTFQVTTRDNRANGGGINTDTVEVNTTNTGAAFAVTQPNTAVTWASSSTQTVTWNVASTTAAPISTANVRILLSTDGGATFPTVLLTSTPNDGTQTVSIPNVSTILARIKVESVGNIFFDISNTNFTIGAGAATYCNTTAITIPATLDNAAPYPSAVTVSGVSGTIPAAAGSLQVRLNNFSHTFPDDVGAVLVGPTGAALLLQFGAGDNPDMSNVTYTLSDTGATFLPNATTWVAGTYAPTTYYLPESFPAPGPGLAYSSPQGAGTATLSSTFGGTNPNGTWNLYVRDFANTDGGSFAGGWCLLLSSPTSVRANLGGRVTLPDGQSLTGVNMSLLSTGNSSTTVITTGADGRYQFNEETGNDYLITPTLAGYTFNPVNQFISHTGERTNVDFVATPDSSQPGKTLYDFDGDGKTDVSVFRPSNGGWYILRSSDQVLAAQLFGLGTDRLVPGDYDGDERADIAVFRDGIWYMLLSANGAFRSQRFGQSGDVPAPADYDGDGKFDLAVFRQGEWYILHSSDNGFHAYQFGLPEDKPVTGDYDGDGKADLAVFRGGDWYVLQSTEGFRSRQFGLSADTLVPADYDGDGKADLAVFRNGVWMILRSKDGAFNSVPFGLGSDVPTPGDYDGDGKTDIAVFRPAEGNWYLLQSLSNILRAERWGISGDVPVPSAYIP